MLLETCRYKLVNGQVITKMFGMKNGEWDIDEGWCHDKKEAMSGTTEPKLVNKKEYRASRFALKLAGELNVDITKVTGTGTNGAVSKDDIVNYYNSLES